MLVRLKKTAATVCVTAMAVVAVAAPPSAAQQQQDGLINIAIGDITIEDVNIGVAALIAANVCGQQVGPVVVLAQKVDATSQQETVCTTDTGNVVLTQN